MPSVVVTTSLLKSVPLLTTFTCALATRAPEGSETTPTIAPVPGVWAESSGVTRSIRSAAKESRRALATQTAPRARAPGYLLNRPLSVNTFFDAGRIPHVSKMFISLPVRFPKVEKTTVEERASLTCQRNISQLQTLCPRAFSASNSGRRRRDKKIVTRWRLRGDNPQGPWH